jgi:hypothetical protein
MKYILAIVFLILTQLGVAQKKDRNYYYNKRVHVGFKGGANIIKFDGKGWNDGLKYGFHAGGFVQLKLTGRFSLQGELQFSQIVADTAKDFTDVVDFIRFSETRETLKLNYLDIPIVLNIGIGPIHAVKLQLGVQYGILMNKSITLLENGKNALKNGQLSALGGIMFQFGPVNLTGRYLISLDNLNNVTNKAYWKTQVGQISIGITI